MHTIIDPVPVELIKAELTPSKKLEDTNKGHNELYIVTWQDSPNVVTEIGRLREAAFREAGGSSGNAVDLDGGQGGARRGERQPDEGYGKILHRLDSPWSLTASPQSPRRPSASPRPAA